MPRTKLRLARLPAGRFAGVELYFHDLDRAKKFYVETLGLRVADQAAGRFVRFDSGSGFICLERKGSERYPSQDKAVLFFEVPDVGRAVKSLGRERVVGSDLSGKSRTRWAVLHDPEGHNILLLQSSRSQRGRLRKGRRKKPMRARRRP